MEISSRTLSASTDISLPSVRRQCRGTAAALEIFNELALVPVGASDWWKALFHLPLGLYFCDP